jgi:hypothetical protein
MVRHIDPAQQVQALFFLRDKQVVLSIFRLSLLASWAGLVGFAGYVGWAGWPVSPEKRS